MLDAAHMRPLTRFVRDLHGQRGDQPGIAVPDLDPLDGGIEASLLLLLEKPGPMTALDRVGARAGSGFVSRNNDDPTAEATDAFLRQAGIPRGATAIWNVIPWWNGTIVVTAAELRQGVARVREFVALLPRLRAVVLVGNRAARAAPLLRDGSLALFASVHPSPQVRAAFPDRWHTIPDVWREAYEAAVRLASP